MKRIVPFLIAMTLLTATGFLSACNSAELFLSEKDKQPSVNVVPYAVTPGLIFSGGVPLPFQQYGVIHEVSETGEFAFSKPLGPITQTRFELTIESYNINQGFEVLVIMPSTSFPTFQFTLELPFEDPEKIRKIPTSDGGRGPGGLIIVPIAAWSPANIEVPEDFRNRSEVPSGKYPFKFIVTDQEGRVAVATETITVSTIVTSEEVLTDEQIKAIEDELGL